MHEPTTTGGAIPSFLGATVAFLSGFSPQTFAHLAGGAAALAGLGYTLWCWRRDAKKLAREEAALGLDADDDNGGDRA